MSCKEALSWLKSLGHNKVVLELNTLNVFTALVSSNMDIFYFGSIIKDREILAKDLGECYFSFVKRSVNRVAHALARAIGSESNHGE